MNRIAAEQMLEAEAGSQDACSQTAAQAAAENFRGEVALVWLSLGARSELEAETEDKDFLFIPVRGELSDLGNQE